MMGDRGEVGAHPPMFVFKWIGYVHWKKIKKRNFACKINARIHNFYYAKLNCVMLTTHKS